MSILQAVYPIAACILLAVSIILSVRLSRIRAEQEQLNRQLAAAHAELESYACIAPNNLLRLLKLLNYRSGTPLEVGMHRQVESVVMDVNMPAFSEFSHGKAPLSIVNAVNSLLAGIIPVVQQSGGTIERFGGAGLSALFGSEYERAVTAAVSICEEAARREDGDAITIGICDGSVLLGVVGNGDTMTVLALTGDSYTAAPLRALGYQYNARIVVTAQILENIPDGFRRFNCRRLGCVLLAATQTLVWVYDIFDGDCADMKNSKRKTKMVFEKGVALFFDGDIMAARQHFVEVLKNDSRDRAAKEYLLLCDGVLNKQMLPQSYIGSI